MAGALIILFVLITNFVASFVRAGMEDSETPSGSSSYGQCNTSQNITTCESVGKASFFSAVVGTTFTGFGSDAPEILNILWGMTMGFLLTVAVLLIVFSAIPLTSE